MYKGISSIGPLITTVHLYICLRKSRVYDYFGFARMTQMLTIQEKGKYSYTNHYWCMCWFYECVTGLSWH